MDRFLEKLKRANEVRNAVSMKIKDLEQDVEYVIREIRKTTFTENKKSSFSNGVAVVASIIHPKTEMVYSIFLGTEYTDIFDKFTIERINRGALKGVFTYTGCSAQKQLYRLEFEEVELASKRQKLISGDVLMFRDEFVEEL